MQLCKIVFILVLISLAESGKSLQRQRVWKKRKENFQEEKDILETYVTSGAHIYIGNATGPFLLPTKKLHSSIGKYIPFALSNGLKFWSAQDQPKPRDESDQGLTDPRTDKPESAERDIFVRATKGTTPLKSFVGVNRANRQRYNVVFNNGEFQHYPTHHKATTKLTSDDSSTGQRLESSFVSKILSRLFGKSHVDVDRKDIGKNNLTLAYEETSPPITSDRSTTSEMFRSFVLDGSKFNTPSENYSFLVLKNKIEDLNLESENASNGLKKSVILLPENQLQRPKMIAFLVINPIESSSSTEILDASNLTQETYISLSEVPQKEQNTIPRTPSPKKLTNLKEFSNLDFYYTPFYSPTETYSESPESVKAEVEDILNSSEAMILYKITEPEIQKDFAEGFTKSILENPSIKPHSQLALNGAVLGGDIMEREKAFSTEENSPTQGLIMAPSTNREETESNFMDPLPSTDLSTRAYVFLGKPPNPDSVFIIKQTSKPKTSRVYPYFKKTEAFEISVPNITQSPMGDIALSLTTVKSFFNPKNSINLTKIIPFGVEVVVEPPKMEDLKKNDLFSNKTVLFSKIETGPQDKGDEKISHFHIKLSETRLSQFTTEGKSENKYLVSLNNNKVVLVVSSEAPSLMKVLTKEESPETPYFSVENINSTMPNSLNLVQFNTSDNLFSNALTNYWNTQTPGFIEKKKFEGTKFPIHVDHSERTPSNKSPNLSSDLSLSSEKTRQETIKLTVSGTNIFTLSHTTKGMDNSESFQRIDSNRLKNGDNVTDSLFSNALTTSWTTAAPPLEKTKLKTPKTFEEGLNQSSETKAPITTPALTLDENEQRNKQTSPSSQTEELSPSSTTSIDRSDTQSPSNEITEETANSGDKTYKKKPAVIYYDLINEKNPSTDKSIDLEDEELQLSEPDTKYYSAPFFNSSKIKTAYKLDQNGFNLKQTTENYELFMNKILNEAIEKQFTVARVDTTVKPPGTSIFSMNTYNFWVRQPFTLPSKQYKTGVPDRGFFAVITENYKNANTCDADSKNFKESHDTDDTDTLMGDATTETNLTAENSNQRDIKFILDLLDDYPLNKLLLNEIITKSPPPVSTEEPFDNSILEGGKNGSPFDLLFKKLTIGERFEPTLKNILHTDYALERVFERIGQPIRKTGDPSEPRQEICCTQRIPFSTKLLPKTNMRHFMMLQDSINNKSSSLKHWQTLPARHAETITSNPNDPDVNNEVTTNVELKSESPMVNSVKTNADQSGKTAEYFLIATEESAARNEKSFKVSTSDKLNVVPLIGVLGSKSKQHLEINQLNFPVMRSKIKMSSHKLINATHDSTESMYLSSKYSVGNKRIINNLELKTSLKKNEKLRVSHGTTPLIPYKIINGKILGIIGHKMKFQERQEEISKICRGKDKFSKAKYLLKGKSVVDSHKKSQHFSTTNHYVTGLQFQPLAPVSNLSSESPKNSSSSPTNKLKLKIDQEGMKAELHPVSIKLQYSNTPISTTGAKIPPAVKESSTRLLPKLKQQNELLSESTIAQSNTVINYFQPTSQCCSSQLTAAGETFQPDSESSTVLAASILPWYEKQVYPHEAEFKFFPISPCSSNQSHPTPSTVISATYTSIEPESSSQSPLVDLNNHDDSTEHSGTNESSYSTSNTPYSSINEPSELHFEQNAILDGTNFLSKHILTTPLPSFTQEAKILEENVSPFPPVKNSTSMAEVNRVEGKNVAFSSPIKAQDFTPSYLIANKSTTLFKDEKENLTSKSFIYNKPITNQEFIVDLSTPVVKSDVSNLTTAQYKIINLVREENDSNQKFLSNIMSPYSSNYEAITNLPQAELSFAEEENATTENTTFEFKNFQIIENDEGKTSQSVAPSSIDFIQFHPLEITTHNRYLMDKHHKGKVPDTFEFPLSSNLSEIKEPQSVVRHHSPMSVTEHGGVTKIHIEFSTKLKLDTKFPSSSLQEPGERKHEQSDTTSPPLDEFRKSSIMNAKKNFTSAGLKFNNVVDFREKPYKPMKRLKFFPFDNRFSEGNVIAYLLKDSNLTKLKQAEPDASPEMTIPSLNINQLFSNENEIAQSKFSYQSTPACFNVLKKHLIKLKKENVIHNVGSNYRSTPFPLGTRNFLGRTPILSHSLLNTESPYSSFFFNTKKYSSENVYDGRVGRLSTEQISRYHNLLSAKYLNSRYDNRINNKQLYWLGEKEKDSLLKSTSQSSILDRYRYVESELQAKSRDQITIKDMDKVTLLPPWYQQNLLTQSHLSSEQTTLSQHETDTPTRGPARKDQEMSSPESKFDELINQLIAPLTEKLFIKNEFSQVEEEFLERTTLSVLTTICSASEIKSESESNNISREREAHQIETPSVYDESKASPSNNIISDSKTTGEKSHKTDLRLNKFHSYNLMPNFKFLPEEIIETIIKKTSSNEAKGNQELSSDIDSVEVINEGKPFKEESYPENENIPSKLNLTRNLINKPQDLSLKTHIPILYYFMKHNKHFQAIPTNGESNSFSLQSEPALLEITTEACQKPQYKINVLNQTDFINETDSETMEERTQSPPLYQSNALLAPEKSPMNKSTLAFSRNPSEFSLEYTKIDFQGNVSKESSERENISTENSNSSISSCGLVVNSTRGPCLLTPRYKLENILMAAENAKEKASATTVTPKKKLNKSSAAVLMERQYHLLKELDKINQKLKNSKNEMPGTEYMDRQYNSLPPEVRGKNKHRFTEFSEINGATIATEFRGTPKTAKMISANTLKTTEETKVEKTTPLFDIFSSLYNSQTIRSTDQENQTPKILNLKGESSPNPQVTPSPTTALNEVKTDLFIYLLKEQQDVFLNKSDSKIIVKSFADVLNKTKLSDKGSCGKNIVGNEAKKDLLNQISIDRFSTTEKINFIGNKISSGPHSNSSDSQIYYVKNLPRKYVSLTLQCPGEKKIKNSYNVMQQMDLTESDISFDTTWGDFCEIGTESMSPDDGEGTTVSNFEASKIIYDIRNDGRPKELFNKAMIHSNREVSRPHCNRKLSIQRDRINDAKGETKLGLDKKYLCHSLKRKYKKGSIANTERSSSNFTRKVPVACQMFFQPDKKGMSWFEAADNNDLILHSFKDDSISSPDSLSPKQRKLTSIKRAKNKSKKNQKSSVYNYLAKKPQSQLRRRNKSVKYVEHLTPDETLDKPVALLDENYGDCKHILKPVDFFSAPVSTQTLANVHTFYIDHKKRKKLNDNEVHELWFTVRDRASLKTPPRNALGDTKVAFLDLECSSKSSKIRGSESKKKLFPKILNRNSINASNLQSSQTMKPQLAVGSSGHYQSTKSEKFFTTIASELGVNYSVVAQPGVEYTAKSTDSLDSKLQSAPLNDINGQTTEATTFFQNPVDHATEKICFQPAISKESTKNQNQLFENKDEKINLPPEYYSLHTGNNLTDVKNLSNDEPNKLSGNLKYDSLLLNGIKLLTKAYIMQMLCDLQVNNTKIGTDCPINIFNDKDNILMKALEAVNNSLNSSSTSDQKGAYYGKSLDNDLVLSCLENDMTPSAKLGHSLLGPNLLKHQGSLISRDSQNTLEDILLCSLGSNGGGTKKKKTSNLTFNYSLPQFEVNKDHDPSIFGFNSPLKVLSSDCSPSDSKNNRFDSIANNSMANSIRDKEDSIFVRQGLEEDSVLNSRRCRQGLKIGSEDARIQNVYEFSHGTCKPLKLTINGDPKTKSIHRSFALGSLELENKRNLKNKRNLRFKNYLTAETLKKKVSSPHSIAENFYSSILRPEWDDRNKIHLRGKRNLNYHNSDLISERNDCLVSNQLDSNGKKDFVMKNPKKNKVDFGSKKGKSYYRNENGEYLNDYIKGWEGHRSVQCQDVTNLKSKNTLTGGSGKRVGRGGLSTGRKSDPDRATICS